MSRQLTIVVGAPHIGEAAIDACIQIKDGSGLILVREPNNPKDANAILFLDLFGRPVGYVQRKVAAIVARWMDEGYLVSAKCIRGTRFIGYSMTGSKVYKDFKYPKAAIYREDPPSINVHDDIDININIDFKRKREKENV